VPADRSRRPPSDRRHRSRSNGERPIIDTYPVIHGPPPERHAWALVHDGWMAGSSPREQLVAERQVARRRLARSVTRIDDDQIIALLLNDRDASLIATHFRHPSAIPGALESFLCDVKRLRVEQAAAVAKLDTYDALLVDDAVEPRPNRRPASPRRSSRAG